MQIQGHPTAPATPTAVHPGLHAARGGSAPHATQAWQPRAKKHVADLLDDADALADWHRNLERLRHAANG
jgi:hypothetical protein